MEERDSGQDGRGYQGPQVLFAVNASIHGFHQSGSAECQQDSEGHAQKAEFKAIGPVRLVRDVWWIDDVELLSFFTLLEACGHFRLHLLFQPSLIVSPTLLL